MSMRGNDGSYIISYILLFCSFLSSSFFFIMYCLFYIVLLLRYLSSSFGFLVRLKDFIFLVLDVYFSLLCFLRSYVWISK